MLSALSRVGYGAAPLGNVYGDIDPAIGIASVHRAIELGVSFFDVSPYYGLTMAEEVLGRALIGHRHEVILCTKTGRYGVDYFDFSADRIVRSAEESLRRLRTGYVDVLLAHDIEFGPPEQVLGETIDALQRLKAQGVCRFICVSGYPLGVLRRALGTGALDVVLGYCHYCLFNTQLETELIPAAEEQGVAVINASPLGMGLLVDAGQSPPSWHPASPALRDACTRAAALCRERGASLADLALQFAIQEPHVATTVVGMATSELVERNLRVAAEPPDGALLALVQEILAPVQGAEWDTGRAEWKIPTETSAGDDASVGR